MDAKTIETRAKELENVMHKMRRSGLGMQKVGGLKNAERHMLWLLYSSNCNSVKIKSSDLAKKLGVTMSAVTHLINSLVKAGLVTRNANQNDRREAYLELTAAGKAKIASIKQNYWKKLYSLVEYLGDEDSAKFLEIVTRISSFSNNLFD